MRWLRLAVFGLVLVGLLVLSGCNAKGKDMDQLPDIPSNIKSQLTFTCAHEKDRVPPRDPDAEQLYRHARWLVKGNILKQQSAVYPSIERLLRIAVAYGHDRANIELRAMLQKGQAASPDTVSEVIDLVQDLIKRGIPAGYYDMAWYLERGYGVEQNQELAFKYYRKSADLGSPEGQFHVGSLLADKMKNGDEIAAIGNAMRRCAADQQHAEAAERFAIRQKNSGNHTEALKYFQLAAMAGQSGAAYSLTKSFGQAGQADEMYKLHQQMDEERSARYEKISDFLFKYEYLNPKVPELDQIVPLPPAKLPPWDGKFQWLEAHKANVPPPLPGEARIVEMAKAKGLDPSNGRPLKTEND